VITKEKIKSEIRTVFLTTLYFFSWFGGLYIIKVLLLKEYNIEFSGFSAVLLGALICAKVVMILEYVSIPFTKTKPVWVEVLVRTFLYLIGIFIVLVLEKSFEARHEYGGFIGAFKNLKSTANDYHIYVNMICVSGAILVYNIWSVIKLKLGKGLFRKLMTSKIEDFE
jgi:hypothetical protein